MEIIRGKITGAQKCVIYGPEGIGKSTFASHFPNPLFIDTEGSTKHMDVARLPRPSSWTMLMDQVQYVKDNPSICDTLIVDTADWAEQLCIDHVIATKLSSKDKKVNGIEDFGYGKGYTYVGEEFGRLLNKLEEIISQGIHVNVCAHAKMRKFEQPDEMGAYDRWEMKLSKNVYPLLKEWADMVLFANYKTYVINIDNQGAVKGKNKAQGGSRVMYSTHHSCWDAKNRHGLTEELPFEFAAIAHLFPARESLPLITAVPAPAAPPVRQETPPPAPIEPPVVSKPAPVPVVIPDLGKVPEINKALPKALRDLMEANQVGEGEIQTAVAARGYYPKNTPIENYDPNFIAGVLIGAWPQVFEMVKSFRSNEAPF